jgi:GNAT superfamily N-acetyltransferase
MSHDDLADGWGPADPLDDTFSRAGVESLADRVRHHATALGRDAIDDGRWVAAALADGGLFSNAGIVVRPQHDWSWAAPALASLAPAGVPKLLMSPFPTPDLRGDGLQLVGHPPFMVRPAGGDPPSTPTGVEIRRVDDADDLAAFERTLIEAYPIDGMDPAGVPLLFPPGYLHGGAHLYLALADGRPVATAAAHVAAGVNHVEFVSTRPECRGRGIGAAITLAATMAAPSLPAVLIASDDGRGVYAALGYMAVSRWTIWLGL